MPILLGRSSCGSIEPDHDIAALVTGIHERVGPGDVGQREGCPDVGAQRALGGEVGKIGEVGWSFAPDPGDDLHAVATAVPFGQNLTGQRGHDKTKAATRHENGAAVGGSGLTRAIEDHVKSFIQGAEIFGTVVDHLIRAETSGESAIGGG